MFKHCTYPVDDTKSANNSNRNLFNHHEQLLNAKNMIINIDCFLLSSIIKYIDSFHATTIRNKIIYNVRWHVVLQLLHCAVMTCFTIERVFTYHSYWKLNWTLHERINKYEKNMIFKLNCCLVWWMIDGPLMLLIYHHCKSVDNNESHFESWCARIDDKNYGHRHRPMN